MDNNHKRKVGGRMKKYLLVLPVLIFALLIIGTVPVKSELNSDDFYFLEEKIYSYGNFSENGIRLEYHTKNNIDNEILNLKKIFEKQFKEEVNINNNTIIIGVENRELKAVVWSNEGYTKVQITYVNSDNKITTNQLKKEIEQIEYFATQNIKYFNFVKVKIIEEREQDILDLLKCNIKEETLEELNKDIYDSEYGELKSIIEMGRKYIEQIKTVRNDLYKDEIALKLDKLQNIASQILNYVEKNPKKLQEVNKFINHYLPITIKLVHSYKELNNQTVQGDNIKNAKLEIEKSIDIINNAFENLLDDLYEDIVLDISTDISVLKTLFKQEGLTEEDFKK